MQNLDVALKNLKICASVPQEAVPPASSSLHTFVYCRTGSFLCHADGRSQVVRANQLTLVPKGQKRLFHPLPDFPLSVVSFPMEASCHDTDFFDFFGLWDDMHCVDIPPEQIDSVLQGMTAYTEDTHPTLSELSRIAGGMELCTLYLEARISAEDAEDTCKEIIDHMQMHLSEDLSLDELSRRHHYNPVYFSQKFKEKTGISPIKYLAQLRIQKATQLLLDTSKNVSEIGAETGFQSAYYFRTFFGKYVGLSPDDFRRKYKKEQL